MSRLLLVANRLPVTAMLERGQVVVRPSSGGLASALSAAREETPNIWVGWPGELPAMNPAQRRQFDWQMTSHHVIPVILSRDELHDFYENVSNGVLWPVSHGLLDNVPLEMHGWATYRAVNQRFADAVVDAYEDGDTIWVHDYQLMLVPSMLRERLPHARIGYFHHIPFPSEEAFRVLPWREELLHGLMGANLVGFQSTDCVRNFSAAARRTLGVDGGDDWLIEHGHRTQLGAFPISIDFEAWNSLATSAEVAEEAKRFRATAPDEQILLGVDRLDYTKGILRRLLAFERLLEQNDNFLGRVRFVQVTVPSREKIQAYATMKRRVDELVGRINGRFGTAHWMPVHRIHAHLTLTELSGLYRAADVLLVTPLRDGMNLVVKEFAATRTDGTGAIVLSEFAGAATQLTRSLLVNPYDINAVATAIRRALDMPVDEQRDRMVATRAQIQQFDIRRWNREFMQSLDDACTDDDGDWLDPLSLSPHEEPVAMPV
jgi:trehalose 6-phosphate synthase/phosphatase